MASFQPADPDYERRIRASFARQGAMALIGARLGRVAPGVVEIELPFRADLTQQHGYFHAGMTSAIADSAGGYAAYSLFPADSSVLTVEYKMNLIAPADGERLIATGRVRKPGRTLTVCDLEVVAIKGGKATPCALGLQTLICLRGKLDASVKIG
ncbi:MAG: PaaI family thioesterase [Betaproteobacteria bacterium]|nr:PaaI family thioesterase [Betaproteobacteria bacterium]